MAPNRYFPENGRWVPLISSTYGLPYWKGIWILEYGKFLLVESRIRENFAYGIRNPWVLESGITLTIGIHNPSSTVKYWTPVPGIDSMESRIQDYPGFPYLGRLSNKMLARVGIMNRNK